MFDKLTTFELSLLDGIQQHLQSPFMDGVMKFITTLGNGGIIWIVLGLVLAFTKKYRVCGITALSGMVMGLLIGNALLKNLIQRDRPCWINDAFELIIENPSDYSFPSGHTLAAFITAFVVIRYSRAIGIPTLLLAMLMAFTRLYLYVHFPTDILGGIVLAAMIAVTAIILVPKAINAITEKWNTRKTQNYQQ